ncbi:DUF6456 domain-containing protein [Ochrobactrum vermis]|uniref:DUF6456 domain-containing protein n=1 Tax=Ochrobactrum vermis TaxID=1827297 RepID=A0ABU8P9I7_9HYPH|nr:DUF6456 domain-containing protein [Ochrobactrum vermis]PQZ29286.1 hypothetical protein CQZ93_03195 [Ochrobactrum vermis]
MTKQLSVSEARIMCFLKNGVCEVQDSVRATHVLLATDQGTIAASRSELDVMQKKGLLRWDEERLVASPHCAKRLKEDNKPLPRPAENAQTIEYLQGEKVEINPEESPLAMLYRRRNANGSTFISESEFLAGERLRADFTRGSLMPSVTMRWDTGVGGGRSGPGGMAELTDIALASRIRVERALEAVGPELNGVLVDVCCFLKGLETVERERQWPVRSAKMLLKVGLAALHRHYNPQLEKERGRGVVLHWGADGYRPQMRPQNM